MHTYNINLVGASGVGKTTFMIRHTMGDFTRRPDPSKEFQLRWNSNVGIIQFNVYESIEPIAGMDGYLIMFDLTDWSSYGRVFDIIEELPELGMPIVFCGNKRDRTDRKVRPTAVNVNHDVANSKYYEISAKSNYCYEKPFVELCQRLVPGFTNLIEFPSVAPPTVNP